MNFVGDKLQILETKFSSLLFIDYNGQEKQYFLQFLKTLTLNVSDKFKDYQRVYWQIKRKKN